MIKYVVFTQEELDAIKSGYDIKSIDENGNPIIFTNKEKYENMLNSAREKEFLDDYIRARGSSITRTDGICY